MVSRFKYTLDFLTGATLAMLLLISTADAAEELRGSAEQAKALVASAIAYYDEMDEMMDESADELLQGSVDEMSEEMLQEAGDEV